MTAFRETVVRELRVADNTFSAAFILAGHPLGIATIRILTMIQFVCDGGDSEWDKIEENLSRKLSATLNPLRTNFTKWSHTLKQFVGNLPTNCLSVFDHFVILALKGLRRKGVSCLSILCG